MKNNFAHHSQSEPYKWTGIKAAYMTRLQLCITLMLAEPEINLYICYLILVAGKQP